MTPLAPVLVTPPATLPITVGEAKQHARFDSNHEDDVFAALISTAVAHLDGWSGILGRCIMPQTWAQSFDAFPAGDTLRLPFPDVTTVSVTYRDSANAQQTLPTASYGLFADASGSFLALADGALWPTTYARRDAVRVEFTAGLPAASLPAVRAAICMLVAYWFENREAVTMGQGSEMPMAVSALISPLRRTVV